MVIHRIIVKDVVNMTSSLLLRDIREFSLKMKTTNNFVEPHVLCSIDEVMLFQMGEISVLSIL